MSTKERGDGCYEKALPDEPMFVLLARDPHAPRIVQDWAYVRERAIKRGEYPESDRAQVDEARRLAYEMQQWRQENEGVWRKPLNTGTLFGTVPTHAVGPCGLAQCGNFPCHRADCMWKPPA